MKFGYLQQPSDHTASFDDLAEKYRSAGTTLPDWLQEPYAYSVTGGCYIVKGSGLPYPAQAVLDEHMHQTKLAAILDPDESFDALRRAFFAPTMEVCGMQAFALYDLVDETRGTSEAVDGGILEAAGKLFRLDDFYNRNAAVGLCLQISWSTAWRATPTQ